MYGKVIKKTVPNEPIVRKKPKEEPLRSAILTIAERRSKDGVPNRSPFPSIRRIPSIHWKQTIRPLEAIISPFGSIPSRH